MNSSSSLTFQDLLQLVELIRDSSAFSELRIRAGDVEIDLRRVGASSSLAAASAAGPTPAPVATAAVAPSPVAPVVPTAPAPASAEAPRMSLASSAPVVRDGADLVKAPMVGTIYHAPEPGAAPFVVAGQTVEAGAQLCIIEVMKLMNPVRAERAGTVTEILVADGAVVAFDQPLFVVRP